jgi:hypothetical protein
MNKEEVIKKLLEKAVNDKISCTAAREVMEECKVPHGEIGDLCDEAGIKIYGCELGCF